MSRPVGSRFRGKDGRGEREGREGEREWGEGSVHVVVQRSLSRLRAGGLCAPGGAR